MLGKQDKESLNFIKDEDVLNYVQAIISSVDKDKLDSKFPGIN